jgi:hypothetical protein
MKPVDTPLSSVTQGLKPLDPPAESRPKDHVLEYRPVPETLPLGGHGGLFATATSAPPRPVSSLRSAASFHSVSSLPAQGGLQFYQRAQRAILRRIPVTTDNITLKYLFELNDAIVERMKRLDDKATISSIAKVRRDTEVLDTFDFSGDLPPMEPVVPPSPGRMNSRKSITDTATEDSEFGETTVDTLDSTLRTLMVEDDLLTYVRRCRVMFAIVVR